jgi:hypothetical protein
MTRALAFPTAVVVGIMVLRRPLIRLLGLVETVKYKDLELQIGMELSAIKQGVESQRIEPSVGADRPRLPPNIITLAGHAPRLALEEAWSLLDQTIRKAAARHKDRLSGVQDIAQESPEALVHAMQEANLYPSDKGRLFYRLLALRNKAIHSAVLTAGEALEIGDLAMEQGGWFRSV